jgi:hypothetical protein
MSRSPTECASLNCTGGAPLAAKMSKSICTLYSTCSAREKRSAYAALDPAWDVALSLFTGLASSGDPLDLFLLGPSVPPHAPREEEIRHQQVADLL